MLVALHGVTCCRAPHGRRCAPAAPSASEATECDALETWRARYAPALSPRPTCTPRAPALYCHICAGAGRSYLRPLARREDVSRTAPRWDVEALMRERKRDSRSSAAASSSALSSVLVPARVCAHFLRALSPPPFPPPMSMLPPHSSPCAPSCASLSLPFVRDGGRSGVEVGAPVSASPMPATVSTHRRNSVFAAPMCKL